MRPGTSTAVTGKRISGSDEGTEESAEGEFIQVPVLRSGRGGLIARMLDQGDDRLIEMVRNGMDPAEIRAGECGCSGSDVVREAISKESAR